MELKEPPLNLSILKLTDEHIQTATPVKVLDIFDGATTNFHEEGLFSTTIFGRIGEELRDKQFSYVDLKTEVFHPLIHSYLTELSAINRGVINGTTYAKWNDETNRFVLSDPVDGDTGYAFFFTHWDKIVFDKTKSPIRNNAIALIDKYKPKATNKKIAIIPAGLRDVEIGDDGRTSQHEINDLYRRIIGANNLIAHSTHSGNDPVNNQSRKSIQNGFNAVYDMLSGTLSGKGGFVQNNWTRRQIFCGTRNVITAIDTTTAVIGSKKSIKFTDTVVGLFQHLKAIEPVAKHLLLNGFVSRVFGASNGQAYLVDPKTLKAGFFPISSETYDRWMSSEGLGRVINNYERQEFRKKPVMVDGKYLGLIYLGPTVEGTDSTLGVQGSFKLFSSIDELPDPAMKQYVQPINLAHLLYIAGYNQWNNYPAFITRYPVATIGSIYPSMAYVKTTTTGEVRQELGDDWKPLGDDYIAYEFPDLKGNFFDALSPHPSRLSYLGGDFDGDVCSYNVVFTFESIEETKRILKRRATYVDTNGRLKTSMAIDTVTTVLRNMTGGTQ